VEVVLKFNGFKNGARKAVILAGVVLMTVSVVSAADMQLTAKVTEPFEVRGVIHPAGTLQVREIQDFTPTQTINELWLDDSCLGYLMARRSEAENSQPFTDTMFFTRSPEGHLILAGHTVADSGRGELFRYQQKIVETALNAASLR